MAREFDVVVAGGGIAGLSAGLASARLGLSTLILTGDLPGGQLVSIEKVEGLPGHPDGIPGYDLCPIMQDQAAAAGADFMMSSAMRLDSVGAKWKVTSGEGDIIAGAIILATGSDFKKLDVPGEERLTGSGVSHCATCDAPLLRGRIVAVVGGGDSAMQEGLTLAEFASKVIVFHRGDELVGQKYYRDRVTTHPRIEVRSNTVVSEILGETAVAGLRTRDVRSGAVSDVEIAAVFAYVGLRPNMALVQNLLGLDSAGRIVTDALTRTELPGICAAGTIRAQSPCRATSAAGDGATAAVAAGRFLADGSWSGSETSRGSEALRALAHG
ncbi:MAG TPA: FAD-dependent oxidoreductase [Stellaceae bacterium]|nr:FAD-dependent oxidoreductase [Stellaceae bacterium]